MFLNLKHFIKRIYKSVYYRFHQYRYSDGWKDAIQSVLEDIDYYKQNPKFSNVIIEKIKGLTKPSASCLVLSHHIEVKPEDK